MKKSEIRADVRRELVADIQRVRQQVRGRDYGKAVALLEKHNWNVEAALASLNVKSADASFRRGRQ